MKAENNGEWHDEKNDEQWQTNVTIVMDLDSEI